MVGQSHFFKMIVMCAGLFFFFMTSGFAQQYKLHSRQNLDAEQKQFISALNAYRHSKAVPALQSDIKLSQVMSDQVSLIRKAGRLNLDMAAIQKGLKQKKFPFLSFSIRSFSGVSSGRQGLNYLLSLKKQPPSDDLLASKMTHIGVSVQQNASGVPFWMIVLASQLPQKPSAESVSRQFLIYFNAFRRKHNLSPVALSSKLYRASLTHAQDMKRHQFMGHTGSNGSDIGDRVSRAGYHFRGIAENVAVGYSTALDVLRAWEQSPGHLKNMLAKDIQHIGIAAQDGLFPGGSGQYGRYWALSLGWQQ